MGPTGRRQELQHYVPPHRGDTAAGGNHWRDSTAAPRSHWHDERTISPEPQQQYSGTQQQHNVQQQQQNQPYRQPLQPKPSSLPYVPAVVESTSSLYDSGSWTDQVEEELGERLGNISLAWSAGPTTRVESTILRKSHLPPSGNQPPPRHLRQQQQQREARSPPLEGRRDEGGSRSQFSPPRGRGRGFQSRRGSAGREPGGPPIRDGTGISKAPQGSSPPRWRDRPDYPGKEFKAGGGGGGGDRGRSYGSDQFKSVERGEEDDEDDRYSVVSSVAGGRRDGSKGPVVDLRETLQRRRQQQQQEAAVLISPDGDDRQRKEFLSNSNRGSQSSLNSVGRKVRRDSNRTRKKEGGRNRGDQNDLNSQRPSLPRPKKNTENFSPSHSPPEMRILFAPPNKDSFTRPLSTRDVLVVADMFCAAEDLRIYEQLLWELEKTGLTEQQLWQSWHGDSHVIANDKKDWKERCPTFHWVLDRMRDYFNMDIKVMIRSTVI